MTYLQKVNEVKRQVKINEYKETGYFIGLVVLIVFTYMLVGCVV